MAKLPMQRAGQPPALRTTVLVSRVPDNLSCVPPSPSWPAACRWISRLDPHAIAAPRALEGG